MVEGDVLYIRGCSVIQFYWGMLTKLKDHIKYLEYFTRRQGIPYSCLDALWIVALMICKIMHREPELVLLDLYINILSAIVNDIFKMSISNYSLLICRNMTDICVLTLCPLTCLKSFFSSRNFLVDSMVIFTYKICNLWIGTFIFLSFRDHKCLSFIFFALFHWKWLIV